VEVPFRLLQYLGIYRSHLAHAFQAEVVGLQVLRRLLLQLLPLARRQFGTEGSGDVLGHVALHGEHILEDPIVRVRPEMLVALRRDELRRDPHAVGGPPDRPLDHGLCAQLLGDLRQARVGALVPHGGGSGDHAKSADPGQPRHDVFRHAVAEVLVLGIAAQVGEGQYHDAGSVVRRAPPRGGLGDLGRLYRRRYPDPFRGELQRPGEDQGDGEAEDGEDDDELPGGARELERVEDELTALDDGESDQHVDHRDAVDLTPFQFGQKGAKLECHEWTRLERNRRTVGEKMLPSGTAGQETRAMAFL
jgi:hypothetical protein